METIGLLTWHSNENYGSALQTFALTTVLKKKGYQVEVINYVKDANKDIIHRLYRIAERLYGGKENSYWHRRHLFLNFRKNYFQETPLYSTEEELRKFCTNYDIYVCGSDQIWAPSRFDLAYFLTFVNHKKKIAYAPSAVSGTYDEEQREKIVCALKEFDAISVREPKGQMMIEPIIGRNIKVVLDPTLLLEKEEYQNIMVKPKIEEPYLLCYLLGEREEQRNLAKEIAKKTGLKMVTLPFQKMDETLGDIVLKGIGPKEFLGLIQNASLICTDSYHGMLLSIMLEKNFYIFSRFLEKDKFSQNARVETIIKDFGLESRLIQTASEATLEDIDYQVVNLKKEARRNESLAYLTQALKGEKDDCDNE